MIRPDSSDAVRGLAALALEEQDYDEAYELHRRLIELGEKSPEMNAGLICQKRGPAVTPRSTTSRRSPKTRNSPKRS